MAPTGTAHHAEDVGKILMEVQADLKALRSDLGATSSSEQDAGRKVSALLALVDKAENDIRLKTEAVLHSALNDQYTTLPAIREAKRTRSQGGGAHRPSSARLTVKEQMQAKRQMDQLLKPNSRQAREFLEERFGIAAPPPEKPREATKVRGRLNTRKTTVPGPILPAKNRNDPGAPPPRLTHKDVQRGMEQLVNRGLVPKYVDLTPAFIKTPAPVLCGQVQMHQWDEQFVRHEPYTNALGFNLSGIKMDMISRAEPVDIHQRQFTTASMRSKPHRSRSAGNSAGPVAAGGGDAAVAKQATVSIVQPGDPDDMDKLAGVRGTGGQQEAGTPRDYNALLDEFSLHQFIIRRGTTLSSTPEFESYKRKHARSWGPIQDCIALLEALLAKYNVPIAYVDGSKMALLAQIDYRQPSVDDLLDCLVNLDQVLELVQVPGRRFRGSNSESNATTVLQAVYRGHLCRRGFRDAMFRFKSALVIQRYWKTILACRHTARVIERLVDERTTHFTALADRLKRSWVEINRRKRVVVHIPSISREEAQRMSMHDFALRQNAQLGRLTWAASSDVEVIYVSPFPLSPDVLQYYTKLLQIQGNDRPEERFKVVFPENYDRFPSHLSIATALLYSPRCLKRIANFCRGKDAYILPGIVGPDDLKLACHLDMPLLAPEPQVAAVYTSKSGARRIFAVAEVNTPPGAYDLYNEHEALHSLARLLFERLDIHRWLFKVDDEYLGRGHAWIDVSHLQCHAALVREKERSLQIWMDPVQQQAAVNKVLEELVRVLPRKVEMAHKDLFPTWEAFLDTFTRVGGVIEAVPPAAVDSPSVNLLIDPTGEVSVQSTHDHMFTADYHYVGATFPQQTANRRALNGASLAVGKVCADKGIIGYVSVDFVSFRDSDGQQRLWAIDLNIGVHDTAVSFEMFRFLTNGHFNANLGTYYADVQGGGRGGGGQPVGAGAGVQGEEGGDDDGGVRCYAVSDMTYHPNLATVQYNVFFNLCRLKGVHFDLEDKLGTAFMLVDSFASGVIGMLCVSNSSLGGLRQLAEGLDFIQLQLGVNRSHNDKLMPTGSFRTAVKEVKRRVEIEALRQRQRGQALDMAQGPSLSNLLLEAAEPGAKGGR